MPWQGMIDDDASCLNFTSSSRRTKSNPTRSNLPPVFLDRVSFVRNDLDQRLLLLYPLQAEEGDCAPRRLLILSPSKEREAVFEDGDDGQLWFGDSHLPDFTRFGS
ncbi:hypothetical protein AFLA_007864 [Aspergillus flavus NRRL3357]|nr:hypothetical protein AFLA_007864 [Aspergillus flavus NRRL3357]